MCISMFIRPIFQSVQFKVLVKRSFRILHVSLEFNIDQFEIRLSNLTNLQLFTFYSFVQIHFKYWFNFNIVSLCVQNSSFTHSANLLIRRRKSKYQFRIIPLVTFHNLKF